MNTKYTVIGTGHGGKAMAGHLALETIIRLAYAAHRTDYWRRDHTVYKLGIGDLSVSELTRYVNEGVPD